MFKKSFKLILLSILGKPLGLLRELLFIFAFGISINVDNYIYICTILSLFYSYINASIQVFIVKYNSTPCKNNKYHLLSSFIYGNHFVIGAIFIISLFLFLAISNISYCLIFILTSISFAFKSYNNILSSILIQNNNQDTQILINYLYHLSILFILVSTLYLGLILLCIGDMLISILITLLLLQKTKTYFFFSKNHTYPFCKKMKRSSVLYVNNVIVILSYIFDQSILKGFGNGYISSMKYSSFFTDFFINGVIMMIINYIIFPKISKEYNDFNEYVKYGKYLLYLTIATLISMTILMPAYLYIIKLKVTSAYVETIKLFIIFTLCSIIPIVFNMYLNLYFLIKKLTKYIFLNCLFFVVCNVTLTYILSVFLGVYGVAMGTLFSEYATLILAFVVLFKVKRAMN